MEQKVRIIARLDIKGEALIKGIQLEGLRVIGSPSEFAKKYYEQGADELIYIDAVASLYGRSKLSEIVRRTAHDIFIPLTVGGGIRSLDDVDELLRCGADKVAINTAAVKDPELITRISRKYGSQCIVLSIEAKRQAGGWWEVYTNSGREKTGIDVLQWALQGVDLGAGEILLTSIDQEGTKKGFDLDLTRLVAEAVNVPIIASGGYGKDEHLNEVLRCNVSGVAFANCLHYGAKDISALKKVVRDCAFWTR